MPAVRPAPSFPLALLALLAAACSPKTHASPKDETGRPRLVRAVPAEVRPVRRELRTTGFLESEHQTQITSRVPGRLRALHADAGSPVRKGDLLAELDDREARSAVEQLQVQLAARRVDLDLAKLEVEAAGRRVAQARLESQRTRAEFERQAAMDKEFVAPKALQEAELATKSAEEALQVAGFNERKAGLDVTRIETSIGELEAKVREATVRLEDHRLLAPFAGVLTTRAVTAGAVVTAGQALFELVDPDALVAWFDRPQSELDLCRSAREVRFTTDALPGEEFGAAIDLVGPVVDRATGHFRMRVRIGAADARRLVPGMFLRARILAESEREALLIPKTAVLSDGDVSVVMAVREGKAIRIGFDRGVELEDLVECRNRGDAGLQAGDLVITSGHEDLKDQTPVELAAAGK